MQTTTATSFPDSHIESLRGIENNYWWYVGRVYWAKRLIHRWLERFTGTNALSYADLGCGTGGFARSIKDEFGIGRALLVDSHPKVLNLVEKYTDFQVANMNFSQPFTLPWAPNLITCMDVIEHLDDDEGFLGCLSSQLAPKGLLVVCVPAHRFLYSQWDRTLGHFRRYSGRELSEKIRRAGLSTLCQKFMWSFLFPAAPYRLIAGEKYKEEVQFESVPGWVNSLLISLSRLEWSLSDHLKIPFGTSLIISAVKP